MLLPLLLPSASVGVSKAVPLGYHAAAVRRL